MPETYVDVPELILQNKHDKVIRASPNLVSILPYRPISTSSNTINFTFQTPSFNTLMSEKVLLSFQSVVALFNFLGTAPASSGAQGCPFATLGGLSLRSFPVERLIQTAQIVLGSTSISFPISDILEATAFASYDMNDFASTAGSFERPVEEVGCQMGATVSLNPSSAPNTPNVANLLCAQSSSATGSYILSGNTGAVQKGGSLNIERIYDPANPNNAGTDVNYNVDNGRIIPKVNPQVAVQFSMSGYLKLPVLQWLAKECKESLSALSQIQINLTLNPLQTIFSYLEPQYYNAGTADGQAGTLELDTILFDTTKFQSSQITLSIRYISPPANYSQTDITRQYYQIDRYITTSNQSIPSTLSSGSTVVVSGANNLITAQYSNTGTTIQSNSFTLPCVPRYLMFFVKPSRNYYFSDIDSVKVSNFYLPIVNLNLTVANRTSQFTSSPPEHLYSMAVESGLRAKWCQYRGFGSALPSGQAIVPAPVAFGSPNSSVQGLTTTRLGHEPMSGAPLILDMSTCAGYSEELAVGRGVPISITASVQVVNTSGLEINNCEFFVLAISPSYLQIDHMNGNSLVVLGGVSAEEAMQVASMDLGTIDNKHQTKFSGGFSFSDIVSKVKSALPMVKNVAKSIAGALENAGYGMTGAGTTGAGEMKDKKLAQVMKKMKQMAM